MRSSNSAGVSPEAPPPRTTIKVAMEGAPEGTPALVSIMLVSLALAYRFVMIRAICEDSRSRS